MKVLRGIKKENEARQVNFLLKRKKRSENKAKQMIYNSINGRNIKENVMRLKERKKVRKTTRQKKYIKVEGETIKRRPEKEEEEEKRLFNNVTLPACHALDCSRWCSVYMTP